MAPWLFFTVLLSALIHAAWNIAAKRAAGNGAVFWLAQVVAAAIALPVALFRVHTMEWTPLVGWFLLAAGVTQALYFLLLARAYRFGDISVVYPIARGLCVAGAAMTTLLVLGEPLSDRGLAGVGVIAAGTVTLGMARVRRQDLAALKPPLFAVSVGACLTLGGLVDKMAVMHIDPIVYNDATFLLSALFAAPFMLGSAANRAGIRAAWADYRRTIFLVAVGSTGSYLIILFVFQYGSLAYITAVRESSVLLGALWGYRVMKERFTPRRGLGMALILAGLVMIRLA
jgi:drug/metabolite transporter (DMT)-like permease